MRVSDWLVRSLARTAGHPHFFGVSGANIEDIYDAALVEHLSPLVCRHEFSAAAMADGLARVSGKPGIVVATSGGGGLNLLPALGESFASRVPIVALVGQPPVCSEGTGAFQETSGKAGTFDLERVFQSIAKYCRKVTRVEELEAALGDAVAAAMTSPRGPSVLILPKDVQRSVVGLPPLDVAPPRPRPLPAFDPAFFGSPGLRTVFILGEGVVRDCAARRVAEWIEVWNARACVTIEAKEAFHARHARFAGVTGVMGHGHLPEVLSEAEQIVVLGTRLAGVDRYGIERALMGARVHHLHDEPPFISGERWTHLCVPSGVAVTAWRAAHARSGSVETAVASAAPGSAADATPLSLMDLAEGLAPLGARPVNWVLDAGNAAASLARDLELSEGSRFLMALGMGGMGYAFGAGIGAHLGNGLPTVVFAGDGAFFMHGSEMHTAIDRQLPVLFVLANNHAHAMCVTRDQLFFANRNGGCPDINRFGRTELGPGLRAMYPALRVETAAERGQLKRAVACLAGFSGPAALVLELPTDEMPPFRPFLDELEARKQP